MKLLQVLVAGALLSLAACGGGKDNDSSSSAPIEPCDAGKACFSTAQISLPMNGFTDNDANLLLIREDFGEEITQQKLQCSKGNCTAAMGAVPLTPGPYMLLVNDSNNKFIGSTNIRIDATAGQVGAMSAQVSKKTTGLYYLKLMTRELSYVSYNEFLERFRSLTEGSSQVESNVSALYEYFSQNGAADISTHLPIAQKIKASIESNQTPYNESAIIAATPPDLSVPAPMGEGSMIGGAVKGVGGFAAKALAKKIMDSDQMNEDPVAGAQHLFMLVTGQKFDYKNFLSSGGEMRAQMSAIRSELETQMNGMRSIHNTLNAFKNAYLSNSKDSAYSTFSDQAYLVRKLSTKIYDLAAAKKCVNDPAAAVQLGFAPLPPAYFNYFFGSKAGAEDIDCLVGRIKSVLSEEALSEAKNAITAMYGAEQRLSSYRDLLKKYRLEQIQYPNPRDYMTVRGKLMSEMYANYNAGYADFGAMMLEASTLYGETHDWLFFLQEKVPTFKAEFAEFLNVLPDAAWVNMAPVYAGDNDECISNGRFIQPIQIADDIKRQRCNFKIIMNARIQGLSDLKPLSFTNDEELRAYLPSGDWQNQCSQPAFRTPNGGPTVIDYDGVNLWTICTTGRQKSVDAMPGTKNKLSFGQSRINQAEWSIFIKSALSTPCLGFLNISEYHNKFWPGVLASDVDATGQIALACSMERDQGAHAVTHISIRDCGLDGSQPAALATDDGILYCANQGRGNFWNRYEMRMDNQNTNAIVAYRFDPNYFYNGVRQETGTRMYGLAGSMEGDAPDLFQVGDRASIQLLDYTKFGRNLIYNPSMLTSGRAFVLSMSDDAGEIASDPGDLMMQDVRYTRIFDHKATAIMKNATLYINGYRNQRGPMDSMMLTQHPNEVIAYRKFGVGIGSMVKYLFGIRVQKGFAHYLRCPVNDHGCRTEVKNYDPPWDGVVSPRAMMYTYFSDNWKALRLEIIFPAVSGNDVPPLQGNNTALSVLY